MRQARGNPGAHPRPEIQEKVVCIFLLPGPMFPGFAQIVSCSLYPSGRQHFRLRLWNSLRIRRPSSAVTAAAEILSCIFPCYFSRGEQSSMRTGRSPTNPRPPLRPELGGESPETETCALKARNFSCSASLYPRFAGELRAHCAATRGFRADGLTSLVRRRMNGAPGRMKMRTGVSS